jgi:hypothetical protein
MILRRATKSISLRPENNTKKMCFYKFVATLLLSLTHKTSKTLQINRLHQIKNILRRQISGDYQRLAYIINDYQGVHFERLSF